MRMKTAEEWTARAVSRVRECAPGQGGRLWGIIEETIQEAQKAGFLDGAEMIRKTLVRRAATEGIIAGMSCCTACRRRKKFKQKAGKK